ncbi:MAG: hypothetical protein GY950_04500, partial [bacterium]|nr:hypothetical protein [bacterium]
ILPFEEEAIHELYMLTSGHPYFTQCLGSSSFDNAEKNKKKSISREIVRKEFMPTVKRFAAGVIWVWDSLSANDQVILYLMAVLKEENMPINRTTIEKKAFSLDLAPAVEKFPETINKLRNFSFIKENNIADSAYDFRVEFIRQWIINEISIEEISKKIVSIDEDIAFHLNNARYYFNHKNFKQATGHYEQILEKSPYHFEALFYLARCYRNRMAEDTTYLDTSLDLFKKSYELNRHKARKEYLEILSEKLTYLKSGEGVEFWLGERGQEIEEILAEIQRINPDDSKVTNNLDIIKQLGKEIGETLEQLEFAEIYVSFQSGFAVDENGHVIGLTLDNIKLAPHFLVNISKLKHLQVFVFRNSGLTDISVLQGLSNLATLDLSSNQLTDISVLHGLSNLTTLKLYNNKLTDISVLHGLSNLKELDLSDNQLSDISVLHGLTNLTLLDLRYNKINKLPETIVEMEMRIDVDVDWLLGPTILLKGNPLESPPPAIIRKGKETISAYFKSLGK